MSNNKKKSIFIALLLIIGLLLVSGPVIAESYKLLAPLPGSSTGEIETGEAGFTKYIQTLFPFMLSVAAVLAFIMLVIGGMQYMASAGNQQTMGDAKDRMTNAVLGLLLAALSVLILRTINPELVSLRFTIPNINFVKPSPTELRSCINAKGCVTVYGTEGLCAVNCGPEFGGTCSTITACEANPPK